MGIVRVHYAERQRLGVADFCLEQDYRLGLGGRHGLAHHQHGIVRGLRIVERDAGAWFLTPGVAIDGYGREIVVPRAGDIDLEGRDPAGCWRVQLHYCEKPAQVPDGRRCKDNPAPRIRHEALVVVAGEFNPPAASSESLGRARAAGMSGVAPWPVLVASYGSGCSAGIRDDAVPVEYSSTRYAGHRASLVRSPSGGALIQLGLSSRTDFYRFLVSTRGSALTRRIGIDRDGILHVWRTLLVSASEASARVAIGHNLALKITTPLPAGPGRRVRIDGQVDALLYKLSASMTEVGMTSTDPRNYPARIAELEKATVQLAFAGGRGAAVRLFDAAKREFINFAEGRPRLRRAHRRVSTIAQPADDASPGNLASFSVEPEPSGGRLLLAAAEQAAKPPEGQAEEQAEAQADQGSPALVLRPGAALEAEPLARELHVVTTSAATDMVPRTELRICGGAADETDTSNRVTVGMHDGANYFAALRVDGARRIVIPAPQDQSDEPVLEVTKTLYMPPIGSKDPLLPDLLMLAYVGGLRRIGNVTTAVTLTLSRGGIATDPAPRGRTLVYDLKVGSSQQFTIKRTLELVTAEGGKGDLSFRPLEIALASHAAHSGTVTIRIENFTRLERKVEIQVLMLVEIGNRARVAVSAPLAIDLTA